MPISIVRLSASDFRMRVPELVSIYIRAMNYPNSINAHRQSLWKTQCRHAGFHAFAAIEHPESTTPLPASSDHPVRGFIYGYEGMRGQWWNSQVRKALAQAGVSVGVVEQLLSNYTELTELHVEPAFQGHNLGFLLTEAFAAAVETECLMLSTPEVAGEHNRAFHLYRRLGFRDIVRNMEFDGDYRKFAILGRRLPLTTPAGS